ncbi:MAG: hypothetical protein ACON38_10565, partial [Akkermansiaceae bacterium]
MSVDDRDVDTLIRRTANMPVSVAMQGEGARWQEAGWWLVPVLVVLMLSQFRREESKSGKESSDQAMQSLWLRKVQTKPSEFLKAK